MGAIDPRDPRRRVKVAVLVFEETKWKNMCRQYISRRARRGNDHLSLRLKMKMKRMVMTKMETRDCETQHKNTHEEGIPLPCGQSSGSYSTLCRAMCSHCSTHGVLDALVVSVIVVVFEDSMIGASRVG